MNEPVLASGPVLPKPHQLLDDTVEVRTAVRKLRDAAKAGEREELEDAIAEFETFFIFYVLKAMRETVQKTGLLDGGMQEELYTALLDQEIAKGIAARGGIGLGTLLRDQLLPEAGAVEMQPEIRRLPTATWRLPVEEKSPDPPGGFGLPLVGKTASRYGLRSDPFTGALRFHAGIDIAAPQGTVVKAAKEGKVAYSGKLFGYGNAVVVEHSDGFSTLYAHHCENLVGTGERVGKDQPIAKVGETGRATGPHLHFEVRKDGLPIDPRTVI